MEIILVEYRSLAFTGRVQKYWRWENKTKKQAKLSTERWHKNIIAKSMLLNGEGRTKYMIKQKLL